MTINKTMLVIPAAVVLLGAWHFAAQSIGASRVKDALRQHNLQQVIRYGDISINSLNLDANLHRVRIQIEHPMLQGKGLEYQIDELIIRDASDNDDHFNLDVGFRGLQLNLKDLDQLGPLSLMLDDELKQYAHLIQADQLAVDGDLQLNTDYDNHRSQLSYRLAEAKLGELKQQLAGRNWFVPRLSELSTPEYQRKIAQVELDSLELSYQDHGLWRKLYALNRKAQPRTPDDMQRPEIDWDERIEASQQRYQKMAQELDLEHIDWDAVAEAEYKFEQDPDFIGVRLSTEHGIKLIDLLKAKRDEDILRLMRDVEVKVL